MGIYINPRADARIFYKTYLHAVLGKKKKEDAWETR